MWIFIANVRSVKVKLRHEFCIFLTMLKSSFSLLTVICCASDGSTPASCVLPLERFTGKLWTKPLDVAPRARDPPPAAGTSFMTGKPTWQEEVETDDGNSLRRWGGGEGVMKQEHIPLCFWGLKYCRLRHRDGSPSTFIIQKNSEFINFCQLSFCLLHVDLSSTWVSSLPQLRHTQYVTHLFLRTPCTVYSPEVTFALLTSLYSHLYFLQLSRCLPILLRKSTALYCSDSRALCLLRYGTGLFTWS